MGQRGVEARTPWPWASASDLHPSSGEALSQAVSVIVALDPFTLLHVAVLAVYWSLNCELSPVTLAGKVPAADETVSLQEGDVAEVELRPERPLVVEAFKDCPTMGRFAMCAAMRVDMRGTLVWTPVIVGVGKIEVRRGSWVWEWEVGVGEVEVPWGSLAPAGARGHGGGASGSGGRGEVRRSTYLTWERHRRGR